MSSNSRKRPVEDPTGTFEREVRPRTENAPYPSPIADSTCDAAIYTSLQSIREPSASQILQQVAISDPTLNQVFVTLKPCLDVLKTMPELGSRLIDLYNRKSSFKEIRDMKVLQGVPCDWAGRLEQLSLTAINLTEDQLARYRSLVEEQVYHLGPINQPPQSHIILVIVVNYDLRLDRQYKTVTSALSLIQRYPGLDKLIQDAWSYGKLDIIRQLEILQPNVPQISGQYTEETEYPLLQIEATERSWQRQFMGDAAEALLQHIQEHCTPHCNIDIIYAPFTAIVQSSGMGKSRVVDELSKTQFIIPMCLRQDQGIRSGFPPPDDEVRDWLTLRGSMRVVSNRVGAFFEALFEHTLNALTELGRSNSGLVSLAAEFRDHMSNGMTMHCHGQYRRSFYKKVIALAQGKLQAQSSAVEAHNVGIGSTEVGTADAKSASMDFAAANSADAKSTGIAAGSISYISPSASDETYLSINATAKCKQLCEFLQAERDRSVAATASPKNVDGPLFILAFDEAHPLTVQYLPSEGLAKPWSVFGHIRSMLRTLERFSMFTLFLSTTGKITQFLSSKDQDSSRRIEEGKLVLIQPFIEIGYDALAEIVSVMTGFDLEKITGDAYMSHLGRPMFGCRWDAGDITVKKDIVRFAAAKLLNRPSGDLSGTVSFSLDEKLACISQRLALQLLSTNYVTHYAEKRQVEGHLRVCLSVDTTLESTVSMSGSEPLLAEAAYHIMMHKDFDVLDALKSLLEGFSVHKGDRGELLSLLLMTLARDAAVGPSATSGHPLSKKRYTSVIALFENLFHVFTATSPSNSPSVPARPHTRSQDHTPPDFQEEFRAAFSDSKLYFNHFIKQFEQKALKADRLMACQARGAAVLCANCQPAIDAVASLVLSGTTVEKDNMSLLMWQTKNDPSYGRVPKQDLFDAMDPFTLGIWEDGAMKRPIIRIVFALASSHADITMTKNDTDKFIAFDIWCAGLSPTVLVPIEQKKEHVWQALLQASHGWRDYYRGTSKTAQRKRQELSPGAAYDIHHYESFVAGVQP